MTQIEWESKSFPEKLEYLISIGQHNFIIEWLFSKVFMGLCLVDDDYRLALGYMYMWWKGVECEPYYDWHGIVRDRHESTKGGGHELWNYYWCVNETMYLAGEVNITQFTYHYSLLTIFQLLNGDTTNKGIEKLFPYKMICELPILEKTVKWRTL